MPAIRMPQRCGRYLAGFAHSRGSAVLQRAHLARQRAQLCHQPADAAVSGRQRRGGGRACVRSSSTSRRAEPAQVLECSWRHGLPVPAACDNLLFELTGCSFNTTACGVAC